MRLIVYGFMSFTRMPKYTNKPIAAKPQNSRIKFKPFANNIWKYMYYFHLPLSNAQKITCRFAMPLIRSKSTYGRDVCHRFHTRLPDGQGCHGLIAEGNNLCNSCNLWPNSLALSQLYAIGMPMAFFHYYFFTKMLK